MTLLRLFFVKPACQANSRRGSIGQTLSGLPQLQLFKSGRVSPSSAQGGNSRVNTYSRPSGATVSRIATSAPSLPKKGR